MSVQENAQGARSHRNGDYERFVAFAFAGANMVAEIDSAHVITYAAGALHSGFGRTPEHFIGQPIRSLVAPIDHEALEAALALLLQRGRLSPIAIRLADPQHSRLALAGLALPVAGRAPRLCLTLAELPVPVGAALARSAHALARATEARLRDGTPCALELVEILTPGGAPLLSNEAVGSALEAILPDALAGEVAPGRFGLLRNEGSTADLLKTAALLEGALRAQGVSASVASRALPLQTQGLTSTQAARALRQALNVFARHGAAGLNEAGFAGGLAGYLARANCHAEILRQAIRDGQFDMAFQPVVLLEDRSLRHYEALIRPRPIPACRFAGPQDFVMLIEALGMADELDLAVARRACDAAAAAGAQIAFNISSQSAQNAGFRERLLRLLAERATSGPSLVSIEMTETAEIEDLAETTRTAEALRAVGVPFCIDDFGAGTADVRLLRALGADIVKLDGSYVRGVAQAGRERAFVAGIVEIARAAGAEILAEHVETEDEARALLSMGVQYGQGWLFGRPGPLPGREPGARQNAVRPSGAARRHGQVRESWG